MNRWIIVLWGAFLASSGQAQIFTPESFGGAAIGGITGAIIGNQIHGQSGEGAAIGAGIGYLLGEVAHANRQRRAAEAAAYYGYAPYNYQTAYDPGYRGNFLYAPYRYYRPRYFAPEGPPPRVGTSPTSEQMEWDRAARTSSQGSAELSLARLQTSARPSSNNSMQQANRLFGR